MLMVQALGMQGSLCLALLLLTNFPADAFIVHGKCSLSPTWFLIPRRTG